MGALNRTITSTIAHSIKLRDNSLSFDCNKIVQFEENKPF